MRHVIAGDTCFAVGTETSTWANGLRFTLYDVRSSISVSDGCPFDQVTWDIEEALNEAGYPVTAVMKGQRLCMIDVDCRATTTATITASAAPPLPASAESPAPVTS